MRTRNARRLCSIAAASCLLVGASSTLADSVYVEDGKIFLADDDLFIYEVSDPSTPIHTELLGAATDVTVEDCKAIVTTGDEGTKNVVVVALEQIDGLESFCDDSPVDDCGPVTYDPAGSVLTVPCVEVFGTVYTLDMKQRGNSDNWFIDFIEEVDDDGDEKSSGDDEEEIGDDDEQESSDDDDD
jgi:hypothetical protein